VGHRCELITAHLGTQKAFPAANNISVEFGIKKRTSTTSSDV
jgi:hypothetical protein